MHTRSAVWDGSKGATTPAHFDEMNNFFVQVSGRAWRQFQPTALYVTASPPPPLLLAHKPTLMQLSGLKRFRLLPPGMWTGLRLFPHFHAQHRNAHWDLDDWAVERFLNLTAPKHNRNTNDSNTIMSPNTMTDANGYMLEATLCPGDVLYLPTGWFHEVSVCECVCVLCILYVCVCVSMFV